MQKQETRYPEILRKCRLTMLFACILLFMPACIKSYFPDISSNEINKYVVMGQITDQEGFQEVSISLSSPVGEPKFIPVKNCSVIVTDDKGNYYVLDEYKSGYYHVWMSQSSITPGTAFKIDITTSDGTQISSAYDRMPIVPEIDSVYFIRKDIPTNNPNNPQKGIQFYVDYNGNSLNSPYVMWVLEETWEYHTAYPITYYFDGSYHEMSPPDYSRHICWKTLTVDNVFTLSTKDLVDNKYKMFPLHFVDNKTSRLAYGYSLLIKQLAISEAAYHYWDQIRINHCNPSGLYQQQPLAVKGNLENKTRPEDEILGYFNASSVRSKRLFIPPLVNLEMDYTDFCSGPQPMRRGWKDGASPSNPVYLVVIEGSMLVLDDLCCDCRLQDGKNVKPDFWPN